MEPIAGQIRVILFDLGGVLVELTGVPVILSWRNDGMTAEELWDLWLSSPIVRAFETGQAAPELFADRLIEELRLPVGRDQFLDEFARWPKRLFAGALELLQEIPPNYVRATLSNSNGLHWPRLMDEMELGAAFDHHFASHLMGKIKPDEDAFLQVIGTLGCEASEILFLDDNHLNVHGANAVGIHAVRVKGVQEARRALRTVGILT